MSISAHFTVARQDFRLAVDFDLDDGAVLAVLGPNGSGKSTLLRSLNGLQPIDRGSISLDGTLVDDVDQSIFVLPERRQIGMMFQDSLLFENLDVLENIAFGLRAKGQHRKAARHTARLWLERLALDELLSRRPSQLSGGQAQRVALARALATEPRVLLLDEPTSSLDVVAKAEIRRDLVRLRNERPVTTIVVTHDPLDAFALADHVLVLEQGRVVQSGELDDVAAHPKSRHVADMVGLSILRGNVHDGVLTTPAGVSLSVPADTPSGPSIASIRPASVSLHRSKPEGSARNSWELRIHDLDRHPERVRVRLTGPFLLLAEITPAATEALALTVGDTVWASVKASEVSVSPDLGS